MEILKLVFTIFAGNEDGEGSWTNLNFDSQFHYKGYEDGGVLKNLNFVSQLLQEMRRMGVFGKKWNLD